MRQVASRLPGNHRTVARAEAMRTVTRVYRVTGSTLGSSPDVAQAVLRSTSRANFTTVEEASKTRAPVPDRKAAGNLLVRDCGKRRGRRAAAALRGNQSVGVNKSLTTANVRDDIQGASRRDGAIARTPPGDRLARSTGHRPVTGSADVIFHSAAHPAAIPRIRGQLGKFQFTSRTE
jgi:hypothetical protein